MPIFMTLGCLLMYLQSSKGLLDIADSKILNFHFQVICCFLAENLVLVIFLRCYGESLPSCDRAPLLFYALSRFRGIFDHYYYFSVQEETKFL